MTRTVLQIERVSYFNSGCLILGLGRVYVTRGIKGLQRYSWRPGWGFFWSSRMKNMLIMKGELRFNKKGKEFPIRDLETSSGVTT